MTRKEKTKFKWCETHPVLCELIQVAVVMLAAKIAESFIEVIIGGVAAIAIYGSVNNGAVGNMGLVSTSISMISHLLTLLLFWLVFRKNLHNFFNVRQFSRIILLGWSSLAIDAFTLVVGMFNHKSYGNVGVALLLGLQPGICEEIMYRIIPIAFVMRSRDRERLTMSVFIFISLLFGLRHGLNAFYGANLITTFFQVLYATGTGFLFAAIYVRTGDIWITMVLHSITDFIYYLGVDAQSGGGILTQGTNFSDAVIMLIYAALYFANAFLVFRKDEKTDISKPVM